MSDQTLSRDAEEVRKSLAPLMTDRHEYRSSHPEEFPDADVAFYDRTEAKLTSLGFARIGDLEDVTLTASSPRFRTFMRVLWGDGGAVHAAIYHVRMRGFMAVLGWLRIIPLNIRVVEFETETTDGVFLNTGTAKSAFTLPLGILRVSLPASTSIEILLEHHRLRVRDYMAGHPSSRARVIRTPDEVIASQNRQNARVAVHRRSVGGVTAAEMSGLAGPDAGAQDVAAAIHQELRSGADPEAPK